MKELTLKIKLTDEQFNLLIKLKEEKWAEYRDRHTTLDEFMDSDTYTVDRFNASYFLARNFGGTFNTMMELCELLLVDDVEDAWHSTYKLSDYGKNVLSQNGL